TAGPSRRCVPGRACLKTDGAMLLAAATARTASQTACEQLRAIIAQLPDLIAVTRGPQHVIVFANSAFARAAGCCEQDLAGRPAGAVLAELGSLGDGERLDQAYQTGTPSSVMEWCGSVDRAGDGTSRGAIWRAVLRPMRTATGAVSGVLIHATD